MTANVEEYFASAPWEVRSGVCVVKVTNELFEADVNGGPETKYEALFDPRLVFDSLRVSFMRMNCGEHLVRLEDALGEYLESEADDDGTAGRQHRTACSIDYRKRKQAKGIILQPPPLLPAREAGRERDRK